MIRWSAVFSGVVLFLASCASDTGSADNHGSTGGNTGGGNTSGSATRPFTIDSMPIDLTAAVWAWPSDVTQWPASQFPPIHIFGKDYQGKVESTLTFDMVKVGAEVLSPITGRVVDVRRQPETCDVELYIGSDVMQQVVSLDHVVTPLAKGDSVVAGQVVATVPAWQCNEPFGRFELMLVREIDGKVQALCPADFWSGDLASKAKAQIAQVMENWNAYASASQSVYSSDELAKGVCLTPTAPAN